jgi:hypothetical protein
MKHSYPFLLLLFTSFTGLSQDLAWAKQFDDNDSSHVYVNKDLTDQYGNVYITGKFGGWIDFDPGPGIYPLVSPDNHSGFIAKYDSSGKLKWAKAIISDTVQAIGTDITAIALDDEGSVYALGSFYDSTDFDPGPGVFKLFAALGHDMFVEKFDSSGNFSWVVQFPGTYNITTRDIAVSPDHDVYVTGTFGGGTFDFDPSPSVYNLTCVGGLDVFFLKLSNTGSFLWAKTISGPMSEYPISVSVDAGANVHLAGYYEGTADFDPGLGIYNLSSNGYQDIFVAKYDQAGNLSWARSFGNTGEDKGNYITCDAAGNTYVTGWFMHTVDFDPGAGTQSLTAAGLKDAFILKLDVNGNYRWAKRVGGYNGDIGLAMSLTDAAVNLVIGFYDSIDVDPGPGSYFLGSANKSMFGYVKLDTAGNFKWAMSIDHAIVVAGNCYMGEDSLGYTYITGRFIGTIDCDPGPQVYNLSSSAPNQFSHFIIKLKPQSATAVTLAEIKTGPCNIYPNPATGIINISSAENLQRVIVTDMVGRIIHNLQPSGKSLTLFISNRGVYTVSLITVQSVVIEKVMVR